MTVIDRTAPVQTAAVTLEFELRHPPAKVWRALTEPALLSEWLLPVTGFALEPGAEFTFRTDPHLASLPPRDGRPHELGSGGPQFNPLRPGTRETYTSEPSTRTGYTRSR